MGAQFIYIHVNSSDKTQYTMVHIMCVRDVSWIQPVHNNNSTQLILTFINVNLPLDGYIIRSNFDTTN